MNELFNELITEIMSLGEARTAPKLTTGKEAEGVPSGKYIRGKFVYDAPRDGNYLGQIKKVGGQSVFFAKDEDEKEKVAATKKAQQPAQAPARKPAQPVTQQPKVDIKQTIGDLEARASSLGERKKQISKELADAMRSGDIAKIQKVINDNGIVMGNTGRLKFKDSDKAGLADEQLSLNVFMALKNMGVTITGRQGKEVDVDKVLAALSRGKKKNPFKPQNSFGEVEDELGVENITSDAEGNVTGCTVEGERLDVITPDEEKRLIEERISRVRQAYESEYEGDEEGLKKFLETIAEYIKARNREHNANIDLLVEIHKKGKGKYLQFPKKGEPTEQATERMVTKLGELVDAHIEDSTKKEVARTALKDMAEHATKMRTAKTREERREAVRAYNAALEAFQTAADGSEVGKNIKDVGESLVALRSVALGKIVLIPDSQSFPLADVLTIGINPVTGENSIELFVVHVDAAESISVADSVKAGDKGNAGVSHEKDAHSEFSPVGTISGEEVKNDLIKMSSLDRKKAIFTPDGKLSSAERKRIIGELEKYGDVAREYFGLPTDPNAEGYLDADKLYEFLSYGKKIACVDGKPASSRDKTRTGAADPNVNSQNAEQWQAWGVVGLMHEAVHNRTIQQQFYRTSQIKRKGLVIADGARTLAKAEFQFSKNTIKPATHNGAKVPDGALPSFSIPANSPENLINGNPCTQ